MTKTMLEKACAQIASQGNALHERGNLYRIISLTLEQVPLYNLEEGARDGETSEAPEIAWTSIRGGIHIVINGRFFSEDANAQGYGMEMLCFILMHETMHILLRHFSAEFAAFAARSPKRANIALDAQVNAYLADLYPACASYVATIDDHLRVPSTPEEAVLAAGIDAKGWSGIASVTERRPFIELYRYLQGKRSLAGVPSLPDHSIMTRGGETPKKNSHGRTRQEDVLKALDRVEQIVRRFNRLAGQDYAEKKFQIPEQASDFTSEQKSRTWEKAQWSAPRPGWRAPGSLTRAEPGEGRRNLLRILQKVIFGGVDQRNAYGRTYRRPNPFLGEGFRGKRRLGMTALNIFVDVSESMSLAIPDILRGLSELCSFSGGIRNLVLWSDSLQGHLRHVRKSSLKSIPAGGWTLLEEGLAYMDRLISRDETMIVISDMETAECDIEKLRQIAKKKRVILLLVGEVQAEPLFAGSRVKVVCLKTG